MNRMKELRIEMAVPMKEAARRLGVPYTTYVNYEKGLREPNSEMLIKIANFYSCSVDYLIGKSNSRSGRSTTVGSRIKPFVSNKGVRLVCKIDSNLYNELADFADVNGRTLEDEIEIRLHESVELTWDDVDIKGRTKSKPPLTIAARGGDVIDTSQVDVTALVEGLKDIDPIDSL